MSTQSEHEWEINQVKHEQEDLNTELWVLAIIFVMLVSFISDKDEPVLKASNKETSEKVKVADSPLGRIIETFGHQENGSPELGH